MVRSVKERVNLTADIRAILDGYPSDNSLLRELLQNSDDAGATKQVFILDDRKHGVNSIIQPCLAESQGPALLCQNDSIFNESNWAAISSAHSSDKSNVVDKIGKYGVGFRSVYHITENPHVLSGNKLLILDPHWRFPDHAGGAEINLFEDESAYADQLSAFAPILTEEHIADIEDGFPGTIIRLPFRTPAQAKKSDIKKSAVKSESIRELLYSFTSEESSHCLLFLRNISSIEIREITADGHDILISRMDVDNVHEVRRQRAFALGTHAKFQTYVCRITTTTTSEFKTPSKTITRGRNRKGKGKPTTKATTPASIKTKAEESRSTRAWRICQSLHDFDAAAQSMYERVDEEVDLDKVKKWMMEDKLYPHVALACPLDFLQDTSFHANDVEPPRGRLFTLLPLPITTSAPMHIHAIFALMSNRQSLDVIHGKEDSIHTNERLRIQWNFAIFEDFAPTVYARMLERLIKVDGLSPEAIWKAWPRIGSDSGNDLYWRDLPKLVIQCVVDNEHAIFPRFESESTEGASEAVFVTLQEALIASEEDEEELLEILDKKLDIAVLLPPDHVRIVLQESQREYTELSPENLADHTAENPPDFDVLSAEDRSSLLAYLAPALSKSLPKVLTLPLFPLINGSHTTLLMPDGGNKSKPETTFLLLDDTERSLFADYDPLHSIPLSELPPRLNKVLTSIPLQKYCKIARLSAEDVEDYLHSRFDHLGKKRPDADGRGKEIQGPEAHSQISFLVQFWKWASEWDGIEEVVKQIQSLHLIPTEEDTLRTLQEGFLSAQGLDSKVKFALAGLGVPFLHSGLVGSSGNINGTKKSSTKANKSTFSAISKLFSTHGISRPSRDVLFVLNTLSSPGPAKMNKGDRDVIRNYLVNNARGSVNLTQKQNDSLLALPVYKILMVEEDGEIKSLYESLGAAKLVYVGVSGCPLPIRKDVIYVDCTDTSTKALVEFANPPNGINAMDEIKILVMAITLLDNQPHAVLDALVSRIVPRLADFPSSALDKLRGMQFVPVRSEALPAGRNNKGKRGRESVVVAIQRRSPNQVVDPKSDLASLFDATDGVFPGGVFAEGRFLNIMRSHGLFIGELTPEMVHERIEYICSHADEGAYKKAKSLLSLLDRSNSWTTELRKVIQSSANKAWLPCIGSNDDEVKDDEEDAGDSDIDQSGIAFCGAQHCCDPHKVDELLFDLCKHTLDGPSGGLRSRDLLACLGWDKDLPFDDIKAQFEKALDPQWTDHAKRLLSVTNYLVKALAEQRVSDEEISSLTKIAGDMPWYVTNVTTSDVVASRHIVLSQESALGAQSGSFRVISERTLKKDGKLLRLMGCTERPDAEVLLDHLETITGQTKRRGKQHISIALEILNELFSQSDSGLLSIGEHHRARLRVPDSKGVFRTLGEVYFNDLGRKISSDKRKLLVHDGVSKSLAERLGILFASSAELGEDDSDVDELQMGEDLKVRIGNVLQGYDVHYALNEYLANAADAGAKEFSLLLDDKMHPSNGLLTEDMAMLHTTEAIFMHNEASLTEDDFAGLTKIGEGGKDRQKDTIGRFGLGSLSMFHFTEVVTVLSGEHVMFLDPYGRCLPPKYRSGKMRNVLRRSIGDLREKYPNVLAPFVGVFDFTTETTYYSGTLFRLPLNNKVTREHCYDLVDKIYYDLACNALLFTSLSSITAKYRRSSAGKPSILWSVTAKCRDRHFEENAGVKMSSKYVDISSSKETAKESWLVTTSITQIASIPEAHLDVLRTHRFLPRNTDTKVRMALCLSSPLSEKKYHLSSSLMLPHVTSLPLHLDAQFALASDRRSLRFEPPSAAGERTPESSYNAWILSSLVPPLYTFTLVQIMDTDIKSLLPKSSQHFDYWWPCRLQDTVSAEVVKAFYAELMVTERRICVQNTKRFAPKHGVFSLEEDSALTQVMRLLHVKNFVQINHNVCEMIKALKVPLPSVTPTLIRGTIEGKATQFRQLFHNDDITLDEIAAVLEFLIAEEVSLTGLPLLPTKEGLKIFEDGGSPIYHSSHIFPDVFPARQFLLQDLPKKTVSLLLAQKDFDIGPLDADGIVALLGDMMEPADRLTPSPKAQKRIDKFWKCPDLEHFIAELAQHEEFAHFPLFPTLKRSVYVSLNYSKAHGVLPNPKLQGMAAIVQKLGFTILKIVSPSQKVHFLQDLQTLSLECFIERSASISLSWESLTESENRKMSLWVQKNIPVEPPEASLLILSKLPVWEVWNTTTRSSTFTDAVQVTVMLPPNLMPKDALLFLKHGFLMTAYSTHLADVRTIYDPDNLIFGPDILRAVQFPPTLTGKGLDTFVRVLDVLLQLDRMDWREMRLPNTNLEMKSAGEIFDTSTPVFRHSFDRTQPFRFLHPSLRHLRLQHLGIQHLVDAAALRICAKAFHDELETLEDDNVSEEQLTAAHMIYHHYTDTLPRLISASQANLWIQFDHLRFIICRRVRRDNIAFDPNIYCKSISFIAAPKDIALSTLESICWSQRACMNADPIIELRANGWNFGVPTAEEVVDHLVVLALRVAPEHPHVDVLLSDLRDTYEWLNLPNNANQAKMHLQQFKSAKLFLNVDDPCREKWEWRSADVLVSGLHFDEDGIAYVREFLAPYKHLLAAAGARSLSDPTYRRPLQPEDNSSCLRSTFNAMRLNDQLTDTILLPSSTSQSSIPEEDRHALRFHRAFMAATIPHLQSTFSSGMRESYTDEISFEGSLFGAKAVIEFTYTGDIQISQLQTPTESLRDFLELLPIADQWDMGDLKDYIGTLIAQTHRLVTPATYKMIREDASRYHLDSLKQFCDEFETKNCDLLREISAQAHEAGAESEDECEGAEDDTPCSDDDLL